MSSCNGNGECLTQCECECYNEETDEYNEVCVCGHREHNGYCPSNCCVPIECRNYRFYIFYHLHLWTFKTPIIYPNHSNYDITDIMGYVHCFQTRLS